MKIQSLSIPRDAASAQAVHKLIQGRSHAGKTTAHRYERRKVREILRYHAVTDETELPFENAG
jgi:hypothetical protein